MAQLVTLTFVALFVASCQAIPGAGLFGFPPVGLAGPHGHRSGGKDVPMILTCAVNFTDHYKPEIGIVNAIAVTIKERPRQYGGQAFGFGGALGFGGSHHGVGGGSNLMAEIDIFSLQGGSVSVAFTETARPEQGCFAEDFGNFFTGENSHGLNHGFGVSVDPYGGYGALGGAGLGGYGAGLGAYGAGLGGYGAGLGGYGAALGGYGAYGGYGGAFAGGYGALGLGLGPFPGHGFGSHHSKNGGDVERPVPGVIANVDLTPGTASEINIDNLSGFNSLAQLAGRGVVVCPEPYVDHNYNTATCEGGILSCCALHYDMSEQDITVNRVY